MIRRVSPLLLCAALLLPAAFPTFAAPGAQVVVSEAGARLMVKGRLIAILRVPNKGMSPEERARLAADRLSELIEAGLRAEQIEARARGEAWGVYANGGLLMIATPEEAKQRKEEPEVTARRWAANLKTVLGGASGEAKSAGKKPATAVALASAKSPAGKRGKRGKRGRREKPKPEPTLKVADDGVAVPVGENRTVALLGTAQGPIVVDTDDRQTAEASPVEGKAAIEVHGVTPGKATISVQRQGKLAQFTVWVKKYAGHVERTPEVRVTGTLTPGSLVAQAAKEHALEALEREPGAEARLDGSPSGIRALPRGETMEVEVPVEITGDAYIPVKTTARVKVTNVALPPAETKTLLYSNDPESVREHQTLFRGLVTPDGTARLLFHHQNRVGSAFTFQVHLVNPNDTPVDVQILGGDAGPFVDPIQVGHRAGERYLSALVKDVGYITRIPAGGAVLVTSARVPHNDTVSGMYNFRILAGGNLVAHVAAVPTLIVPKATAELVSAAENEPHTYSTAQKDESYEHVVGKPWTFMPMGRKAIQANGQKRQLFGNYGVIYNLNVSVKNPTDEMQTVRVVLVPDAGWTRGVFVIDGKIIEAPQIAPPADAVLQTFRLGPHQERHLSIQSIPVGGSFYPVSVVVKS